jgi:hypothetical protein
MTRLVSFFALVLLQSACGWTEADKREFEDSVRPVLIQGYRDFRFFHGDGDYGTWAWSYELPSQTDPANAIAAARDQIQRAEPCFNTIVREDATALTIRCGLKEYRIRLDARRRRLFMLEMATVPGNPKRYQELASLLDQAFENFN